MIRALPYVLMVLFAVVAVTTVVTRPASSEDGSLSLPEKINQACKPWLVNDFWPLDNQPGFMRVSCYDPKTARLRYTLVAR